MNISVCLATYNGEKYLLEQLNSILPQLNSKDEIIIVDDCSRDSTIQVIQTIADPRIKIFMNKKNQGHVQSFGLAISLSKNEIIFLSDQDDFWKPDRVYLMKEKLCKSSSLLVSSNYDFLNNDSGSNIISKSELKSIDSTEYFWNIIGILFGRRNYFGCGMAFHRELLKMILPIPKFVEAHDLWIALAANIVNSNQHMEEKTLTRRIHDNNASNLNRNIIFKIYGRLLLILQIIYLYYRKFKLEY